MLVSSTWSSTFTNSRRSLAALKLRSVSCAARPLPVVVSGSGNWCSSCNARAHLLARSNLVAGGGAAAVVAAGNDPGREAKHASRCEHALTFARHKRTRLSSRRNPADVLRGSMRSGGK